MIHTILSLFLLTPGALAQIDTVIPDNNDRFDISSMMRAQKVDTPLVDDVEEGVASDADNRRHLQNDDTAALLDILQLTRPNTRRAGEVDFAYDPDNLPKIGRAGNDDMLDLEFQENVKLFANNIAKPGRRNAPNDEHGGEGLMENVESKPQGKLPPHDDDTGFGVDDRFNSFEGGTMSEFEENLKKFYTTKSSTERTLNDVEEITESGILSQNNLTVSHPIRIDWNI